jgi:hypothetical protein
MTQNLYSEGQVANSLGVWVVEYGTLIVDCRDEEDAKRIVRSLRQRARVIARTACGVYREGGSKVRIWPSGFQNKVGSATATGLRCSAAEAVTGHQPDQSIIRPLRIFLAFDSNRRGRRISHSAGFHFADFEWDSLKLELLAVWAYSEAVIGPVADGGFFVEVAPEGSNLNAALGHFPFTTWFYRFPCGAWKNGTRSKVNFDREAIRV